MSDSVYVSLCSSDHNKNLADQLSAVARVNESRPTFPAKKPLLFPDSDDPFFAFFRISMENAGLLFIMDKYVGLDEHDIECLRSLFDTFERIHPAEIDNEYPLEVLEKIGLEYWDAWRNQGRFDIDFYLRNYPKFRSAAAVQIGLLFGAACGERFAADYEVDASSF